MKKKFKNKTSQKNQAQTIEKKINEFKKHRDTSCLCMLVYEFLNGTVLGLSEKFISDFSRLSRPREILTHFSEIFSPSEFLWIPQLRENSQTYFQRNFLNPENFSGLTTQRKSRSLLNPPNNLFPPFNIPILLFIFFGVGGGWE